MDRLKILSIISSKIHQLKKDDREILEEDYLDFRGTGLNSVELLTLLVTLEDEMGFEFDDADLALLRLSYVRDLIDSVFHKIN